MYADLLLLICLHGNFDLPVANEWFCNWCSLTKMSKCRCGIGLCNVENANVFEVFLGAGPKIYKYESRDFNLRRISYFAV